MASDDSASELVEFVQDLLSSDPSSRGGLKFRVRKGKPKKTSKGTFHKTNLLFEFSSRADAEVAFRVIQRKRERAEKPCGAVKV